MPRVNIIDNFIYVSRQERLTANEVNSPVRNVELVEVRSDVIDDALDRRKIEFLRSFWHKTMLAVVVARLEEVQVDYIRQIS